MSGYNIQCDPGDLYSRKCYVINPSTGAREEIIGYDSAGNPLSKGKLRLLAPHGKSMLRLSIKTARLILLTVPAEFLGLSVVESLESVLSCPPREPTCKTGNT